MENKITKHTCKTCKQDILFLEESILNEDRINMSCPMCTGIMFTDREYRDLRNQIKVKRFFRNLKFW